MLYLLKDERMLSVMGDRPNFENMTTEACIATLCNFAWANHEAILALREDLRERDDRLVKALEKRETDCAARFEKSSNRLGILEISKAWLWGALTITWAVFVGVTSWLVTRVDTLIASAAARRP